MMGGMRPVVPPPLFVVAGLVAQRALAGRPRPGGLRKAEAAVLGIGSVALAGATTREFVRRDTTFHPLHPEHTTALVTDGPNALTRNPMYLGMAGLLTAHALGLGRWRALLPVAAFLAAVDRLQVVPEEEALRQLFGEEYAAYAARVPRWLGPVRR